MLVEYRCFLPWAGLVALARTRAVRAARIGTRRRIVPGGPGRAVFDGIAIIGYGQGNNLARCRLRALQQGQGKPQCG